MDKESSEQSDSFKQVKKLVKTCIGHSNDLLDGAKLLFGSGKRNIAYHLAALALEEIGKATMIVTGLILPRRESELTFLERYSDDHIKKLFWALGMPSLGKEQITAQQIRAYQDLAREIHYKRLAGLYVDPNIGVQPRSVIPQGEIKNLISLAEARIRIEELNKLQQLNPEEKENLQWFLNATEDDEKRKLIFGRKSLDKRKELGHTKEWIRWLREQFEETERKNQELSKKELSRIPPNEEGAQQPKWKYRIRLTTSSHSIRRRVLAWWNDISDSIKLYPGKRKELIVEFTLPKKIPVQGFWWVGWGLSRKFVVALNIASRGFFWWHIPKDVSRFYEKLVDVENDSDVVIDRSPKLELSWGNNVLEQAELVNTSMVFYYLPNWKDDKAIVPFNFYVTGLSLWSKSDIHVQFEPEVFMNFFRSLQAGMQFYGHWNKKESFEKAIERVFALCAPRLESYPEYIRLGLEFGQLKKPPRQITPSEVGMMKIMCDLYFLYVFRNMAKADKDRQEKD